MSSDEYVPTWKARERDALRRDIMDAARATFAERGYHAATVDEIAARAEVGKGTVYNYVEGGKAGLFLAVLSGHFDELQALAERFLADEAVPLRERFAAFVAACAAYFERHRDLLLVHLREVPQLLLTTEGSEQTARLRAQRNRLIETLVPPLESAMARGEIRSVPAALTAHIAFTALLGYLFRSSTSRCPWLGWGHPKDPQPGPDEASAYLTSLVFDGLRPTG